MMFSAAAVTQTEYDHSLPMRGTVEVEGISREWYRTAGGYLVVQAPWGELRMDGNPDPERVRIAFLGYESGYQDGCRLGKARLQNDFKNLMGLQ